MYQETLPPLRNHGEWPSEAGGGMSVEGYIGSTYTDVLSRTGNHWKQRTKGQESLLFRDDVVKSLSGFRSGRTLRLWRRDLSVRSVFSRRSRYVTIWLISLFQIRSLSENFVARNNHLYLGECIFIQLVSRQLILEKKKDLTTTNKVTILLSWTSTNMSSYKKPQWSIPSFGVFHLSSHTPTYNNRRLWRNF